MLTLGRGKGGLDGGSAPGDAAGQRSAGLQLLASGKPLLEHCLLHRCCGGEGSGRVRERCLPQPEEQLQRGSPAGVIKRAGVKHHARMWVRSLRLLENKLGEAPAAKGGAGATPVLESPVHWPM